MTRQNEKALRERLVKKVQASQSARHNLFDNPMVAAAREAMTPEQIQNYKDIGEHMYNSVDFVTNEVDQDVDPLTESLAYITNALESGLHPSFLEPVEKDMLRNFYNDDEWYKRFGFDSLEI